MKILFPIGFFYPAQLGGPCNSIYWLALALHNEKINVTNVAMYKGVEGKVKKNKWLDTNYGRTIYLSILDHRIGFLYVLTSIFKSIKTDIIHITGLFAPTSLAIGLPLILMKKNIIWSIRGELNEGALEMKSGKKKIILKLLRGVLKKNVFFHSTSDTETECIKRVIGQNARIIQLPNFMLLPQQYEHNPTENYLCYLGRIHPIKGLDKLIKALSLSKEFMNSDYKLLIGGNYNNDYGKSLESLVKQLNLASKVIFKGYVEGEKKEKLLANAKALFLPSISENFGNIIVEALAQGTPVVASLGSPWEVLEKEKSGFWIDNSPEILAKTINDIIMMGIDKYLQMRINARQLCEDKYDVFNNIKYWIAEYNRIKAN